MDIWPAPDGSRLVVEQTDQDAVDNHQDAGTALLALDVARQALGLAAAAAEASRYASAARSRGTYDVYRAYWRGFTSWMRDNGLQALPARPVDVSLYIAWRARTRTVATVRCDLAAIAAAHRDAGQEDPTKDEPVATVLRGIRRTRGDKPRRKTPLVAAALRSVLEQLPDDARGRRDRLLLLVGWGAALRRSELVALDVGDCEVRAEGLAVTVRRSKTDQTGLGRLVGIPYHDDARYDVVRAFQAHVGSVAVPDDPLFAHASSEPLRGGSRISDRYVARLVARVALRAGLTGDFSGHSLRAGFATEAAARGASERSIMAQTGHQSVMVARTYIRPASIWLDNAAAIAAL